MWWAIFWGIAVAVENGLAGFFVFLLSLVWQEHGRLHEVLLDLYQKKKYAEDEAEALRAQINRYKRSI